MFDTNIKRIQYEPIFDPSELTKPSFVISPHMTYFFQNGNHDMGGMADWDVNGLGILNIFCQDLNVPALSIPLNLKATLNLNRGRAWVGFTASTGNETWQVHDVLNWNFSSLRMDSRHYDPVVINGHGEHSISN